MFGSSKNTGFTFGTVKTPNAAPVATTAPAAANPTFSFAPAATGTTQFGAGSFAFGSPATSSLLTSSNVGAKSTADASPARAPAAFSFTPTSATSSLFGSPAAGGGAPSTTAITKGLSFGSQSSTLNTSATAAAAAAAATPVTSAAAAAAVSSMFGAPSTGGLFGAAAKPPFGLAASTQLAAQSVGLFGGSTTTPSSAKPANTFGTVTATATVSASSSFPFAFGAAQLAPNKGAGSPLATTAVAPTTPNTSTTLFAPKPSGGGGGGLRGPALAFSTPTTSTSVSSNRGGQTAATTSFMPVSQAAATGSSAAAIVPGLTGATKSSATPFEGLFGVKSSGQSTTVASQSSAAGINTSDAIVPTAAQPSLVFGTSTLLPAATVAPTAFSTPTAMPITSVTPSMVPAASVTPISSFGLSAFSTAPAATKAVNVQQSTSATTTVLPSLSFGGTPLASSTVPNNAASTLPTTGFTFGQSAATSTTPSILSSLLGASTTSAAMGTVATATPSSTATLSSALLPPAKSAVPAAMVSAAGAQMSSLLSTPTTATKSLPAAATAISAEKPITFKQLEQLLNRLTLDVEAQERIFMAQVLELNAYDRVMRENQQKIFGISEEVKQLEEEKDRFVHTVDFLAQQQTELETMVVELEKTLGLGDWTELGAIGLPDPSVATQADIQRQAMLQLQIQIDAQLKQADDDVNDIIEQVTELQKASSSSGDQEVETIDQIAQILRRQMDTLHWVDEQTEEIKKKTTGLSQELTSM